MQDAAVELSKDEKYLACCYLFRHHLETTRELYIGQNLTAREVCDFMGVRYYPAICKRFNDHMPKGMKRGGRRKGSGNKKGWRDRKERNAQQR